MAFAHRQGRFWWEGGTDTKKATFSLSIYIKSGRIKSNSKLEESIVFIDNFLDLCVKKGVSPTFVLGEIGVSKSAYTRWVKGSEPNNTTKTKIANYFSIDVLDLGRNLGKKKPAALSDELVYRCIDLLKELSSESQEDLLRYGRYLRDREDVK
jgi:transcriptional regulator with XRE-family HTH domain